MVSGCERLRDLHKQSLAFRKSFSENAKRLLEDFSFSQDNLNDLFGELIAREEYPKQNFGRRDFGYPGITLFLEDDVALDLYVWTESKVSIHSHNFTGAFKLLRGGSFQQTFAFEERKPLLEGINLGAMKLLKKETLVVGDVCAITGGDSFIHAIYHIEKPSVTLCLRSVSASIPLSMYLYPSLEVAHRRDLELIIQKKLDLLGGVIIPEERKKWIGSLCDRDLAYITIYAIEEGQPNSLLQDLHDELRTKPWGEQLFESIQKNRVYNAKYRQFLEGKL